MPQHTQRDIAADTMQTQTGDNCITYIMTTVSSERGKDWLCHLSLFCLVFLYCPLRLWYNHALLFHHFQSLHENQKVSSLGSKRSIFSSCRLLSSSITCCLGAFLPWFMKEVAVRLKSFLLKPTLHNLRYFLPPTPSSYCIKKVWCWEGVVRVQLGTSLRPLERMAGGTLLFSVECHLFKSAPQWS